MKKLILGLTLITSMANFASSGVKSFNHDGEISTHGHTKMALISDGITGRHIAHKSEGSLNQIDDNAEEQEVMRDTLKIIPTCIRNR